MAAILAPRLVQHAGLRYVNRLVDPDATTTASCEGRVASSFLGPPLHPALGDRVVAAQQQVELRLDDTAGVIVRHGPFRDAGAADTYGHLLDVDVYDTRSERFDFPALARSAAG